MIQFELSYDEGILLFPVDTCCAAAPDEPGYFTDKFNISWINEVIWSLPVQKFYFLNYIPQDAWM